MSISIELNLELLQEEQAKLHAINMAKQFKRATRSLEKLKALIKQDMPISWKQKLKRYC